jgi:homoserine kinase
MNEVRIFSPATVANVSCGFDVLGFCLDGIGDGMVVRTTAEKGIRITKIEGYNLPTETHLNVAGVSAQALIDDAKPDFGFEIEIYKRIKPGSGIGSSSASAAGSVVAINELLGRPYNKTQLTYFAMMGEAMASKSFHADNLAPGIFGGFTLVKSVEPLEILELPTPEKLFAVIIHPQIEVKTSEARALLPEKVNLKDASTQWANVGSLVHALHTNDYELLGKSLTDVIAEPHRSKLIPFFDEIKLQTVKNGALGTGISGSGPSIFSLCEGLQNAKTVERKMHDIYNQTGIKFKTYISKINVDGIKMV